MKMFIFEMTLHGDAFTTPLPVTAKVEAAARFVPAGYDPLTMIVTQWMRP